MDELGSELSGIASIPPVADDDHNRAMAEHASRPTAIEVGERLADASASAEIVYAFAHRRERLVEVAMAQQSRDPGEPGREHEGLEVFTARDCVREDHQHARVTLHRAADIAHEHERPPPQPRALVEQAHELAAGTDRVPG